VLGFEHSGSGVMEAALQPGMRLAPEALPGSGVSAGAPAVLAPATLRVGELGLAQPSVPFSSQARTGTVEVALATGVRDSVAPPTAAGALQETGGQHSLPGVPAALGPQTPPVVVVALPVPVAVVVVPVLDTSSAQVPSLLPPRPRVERGADGALPGGSAEEADQAEALAPTANPAGAPLDRGAATRGDVRLPQWTCDACFADGSWWAEPVGWDVPLPAVEPANSTPGSVGAAAVLAFALGGAWGADREESERRRQWLS
jgi:hypothetical protein